MLVFGNMNFKSFGEASVKVPRYDSNLLTIPIQIDKAPVSENGNFKVNLYPGEVQVLLVNDFEL